MIDLTVPDDRYTSFQSDQRIDEPFSGKQKSIRNEMDESMEEENQSTELKDPINDLNEFFNDQFMDGSENSLGQRNSGSYRRKPIDFYNESFA